MAEDNHEDTKLQCRVPTAVKADFKSMADKENLKLGGFVSKILTTYWTNKKRKGEC